MNGWTCNVCAWICKKQSFSNRFCNFYKSITDGRTDRRTDRPTDGATDGQTDGQTLLSAAATSISWRLFCDTMHIMILINIQPISPPEKRSGSENVPNYVPKNDPEWEVGHIIFSESVKASLTPLKRFLTVKILLNWCNGGDCRRLGATPATAEAQYGKKFMLYYKVSSRVQNLFFFSQ